MIEKVVTGGQTGVDRAAWDAAKACGIATGGAMPRGFLAEDGRHPEFADTYGAAEHPDPDYPPRTRANVCASDIALVMGDITSRGSGLALRTAADHFIPALCWSNDRRQGHWAAVEFDCPASRQRKPKRFLIVYSADEVARHLCGLGPRVLFVGGNRASRSPGIYDWARRELVKLFRLLQAV